MFNNSTKFGATKISDNKPSDIIAAPIYARYLSP